MIMVRVEVVVLEEVEEVVRRGMGVMRRVLRWRRRRRGRGGGRGMGRGVGWGVRVGPGLGEVMGRGVLGWRTRDGDSGNGDENLITAILTMRARGDAWATLAAITQT
jgi:hypothetical protein